jgi:putative nucleotidyltransferase with HDIG domain
MIILLQGLTIIINRKRLSRDYAISLIAGISIPALISIVQIFCYGLSLTSIGTVFVVIIFYAYAILELNKAVKTAQRNELESYKAAEKREAAMFEQTAEALANAIDAKDQYTHGHSTRVADISAKIARKAGLSDKDCRSVYFAALLHDIGKIGIPDGIINKEGRLTDEEFGYIKQHPILGYQILSSIRQSPELSIGAHYHHERYDGRGYPDGLSGKEIPETARIIAVADAYDAMTSTRSYREKLSMDKTKEELRRGMGSQFDPKFAAIMLQLIDDGEVSKPLNS